MARLILHLRPGWEDFAKAAHALSRRCKWHGLDISIETDKGETRSGTDPDGNTWTTTMAYPYGYLRRTRGVDGDHLDCYLGPDEDAAYVYVIHQIDPTSGKYDEDKVMLDFSNEDAAKRAFLRHYDTPAFYGSMTRIHAAEFAQLVRDGKLKGNIVMGEPSKKAGKLELNTLLDILKSGPKAVKLERYQNGDVA